MLAHPLKLVTIVTEATIEHELVDELNRLGVPGYTIVDARGKGHRGVRDSGWEHGANIRVEIVCDERMARTIANCMRERYYADYAMILFVTDVETLRPEKFSTEGGTTS